MLTGELTTQQTIPPRPAAIPIVFGGDWDTPNPIPAELRCLDRWVLWKYVRRDDKWTKPLIGALSERLASSTDPTTWTDFETSLCVYFERLPFYDGIGFVFAGDGFVGLDLDHCRDPITGTLETWAHDVIRALPGAYVELSPSATGVHLIYKGTAPRTGKRPVGERGVFEAYTTGRYFTVTGARL